MEWCKSKGAEIRQKGGWLIGRPSKGSGILDGETQRTLDGVKWIGGSANERVILPDVTNVGVVKGMNQ